MGARKLSGWKFGLWKFSVRKFSGWKIQFLKIERQKIEWLENLVGGKFGGQKIQWDENSVAGKFSAFMSRKFSGELFKSDTKSQGILTGGSIKVGQNVLWAIHKGHLQKFGVLEPLPLVQGMMSLLLYEGLTLSALGWTPPDLRCHFWMAPQKVYFFHKLRILAQTDPHASTSNISEKRHYRRFRRPF